MLATLNNEKLKQPFIENMLNKDFESDDVKNTSIIVNEHDETEGKYSSNEGKYIHVFEDELNYDLSTLMESNSSDEYSIEFILMYMNDDLKLPFCQYFFENIDNEMVLPKAVISKINILKSTKKFNNENQYDVKHYLFIDQINKILKTNYNINHKNISYKGYMVYNSKIHVLCDITYTLFDYGYMAIYDEIIGGNEIQQTRINEENLSFFKENVNIQQLTDETGNMIDVPIHGYLCNYENDNLTNVEVNDMFEDMINHNIFGMNYVFSEFLLDEDNDTETKHKKYAIFINDVLFKSEDISKLPIMRGGGSGNNTDETNEYDEYSSIYYHDGVSRTFILVKNYEQFCVIE